MHSIAEEMQEGSVTLQVELKELTVPNFPLLGKAMKSTFQVMGKAVNLVILSFLLATVQVVIYTPEYKLAGQIVTYASAFGSLYCWMGTLTRCCSWSD